MLARRLGLSRTTVQAKIERLERDGVIAGYGVRLSDDFESGQIKAHRADYLWRPRRSDASLRSCRRLPIVRSVYSVSGSFDMIAIVASASISELDMVIDKIGDIDGRSRSHQESRTP